MSFVDILAEQLKIGQITLTEWQGEMRSFVRDEYNDAMILQRGGREFITQSDWGYSGSKIKEQYGFLDNFAADIAKEPDKWLNGRLNNRSSLYNQSGYSALEDFKKRDMKNAGWSQERRFLGIADHCRNSGEKPGCIELAAMGWRPIGTLPKIGAATCHTNCKCRFDYRKKLPFGGWIIESEGVAEA